MCSLASSNAVAKRIKNSRLARSMDMRSIPLRVVGKKQANEHPPLKSLGSANARGAVLVRTDVRRTASIF